MVRARVSQTIEIYRHAAWRDALHDALACYFRPQFIDQVIIRRMFEREVDCLGFG